MISRVEIYLINKVYFMAIQFASTKSICTNETGAASAQKSFKLESMWRFL